MHLIVRIDLMSITRKTLESDKLLVSWCTPTKQPVSQCEVSPSSWNTNLLC